MVIGRKVVPYYCNVAAAVVDEEGASVVAGASNYFVFVLRDCCNLS